MSRPTLESAFSFSSFRRIPSIFLRLDSESLPLTTAAMISESDAFMDNPPITARYDDFRRRWLNGLPPLPYDTQPGARLTFFKLIRANSAPLLDAKSKGKGDRNRYNQLEIDLNGDGRHPFTKINEFKLRPRQVVVQRGPIVERDRVFLRANAQAD